MKTITLALLFAVTAQPKELGETEFTTLHSQLRPPTEEGWSSIPWKTSLVVVFDGAMRS